MPGFIPHFLVGCAMFAIVAFYIKFYRKDIDSLKNHFLLLSICLIFSCIPDFPLGMYYLFDIAAYEALIDYHSLLHYIISPLAVGGFVLLRFFFDMKREPIWLAGVICIIIHILMDSLIEEMGVWI